MLWPGRAGDVEGSSAGFAEARAINAQLKAFCKNRVCFASVKENRTNAGPVQQHALFKRSISPPFFLFSPLQICPLSNIIHKLN